MSHSSNLLCDNPILFDLYSKQDIPKGLILLVWSAYTRKHGSHKSLPISNHYLGLNAYAPEVLGAIPVLPLI